MLALRSLTGTSLVGDESVSTMRFGRGSARDPVDLVRLPSSPRAPLAAIGRLIGFALGLLVFIAMVVLIGRNGYTDSAGGHARCCRPNNGDEP